MTITQKQLSLVMPHLDPGHASIYLPYLNSALAEGQINTPQRVAAFLGQVAEESGELRWWHEFATGQEYEGRKDLGNTQPGDGPKFKGRGPIQLTGRANYTAAARDLSVDIVANPDLVAGPQVGFRTTVWFWKNHGLNLLADVGNFKEITRRINGGYTNEDVREAYWTRAKTAVGIS
ncbi:MAG: glycoside hydrolase family 19 protein [Acidiferrobacterales bacterium]